MKRIIIFLGIFISFTSIASAQWIKVLERDETVKCLAIYGKNVFAGTSGGGVFVSIDEGKKWKHTNSGLPKEPVVTSIAAIGPNIIAGTEEDGLFLSSDSGKIFKEIRNGFKSYQVNALALSGTNIYAGTLNGVFISSDNGESWKPHNVMLTNLDVRALTINKDGLFAGTKNGGVFFQANNSKNWRQVNAGLTDSIICALANNGKNVFAGTYSQGVFVSDNNGLVWKAINKGLKETDTSGFVNFNDSIKVLGIKIIGFPQMSGILIQALATKGRNVFIANGDVLLSTDNGISWKNINEGLMYKNVVSLCISENYIYAGTYSSGVWRRPLSEVVK